MVKAVRTMALPKVGDRLFRVISGSPDAKYAYKTEPCVVTYVNEPHHWYQVEFTNLGFKECYNVPVLDHFIFESVWRPGSTPVLCLETDYLYSSISECARKMGLNNQSIADCCRGYRSDVRGYHFEAPI